MRRKLYPINILTRARKVAAAWEEIGTDVLLGNFTHRSLHQDIIQAEAIERKIQSVEIQLAGLRNERDAQYLCLWDRVKRVYAGVQGMYGDDSVQYEMLGRTPASKRKPRARRISLNH